MHGYCCYHTLRLTGTGVQHNGINEYLLLTNAITVCCMQRVALVLGCTYQVGALGPDPHLSMAIGPRTCSMVRSTLTHCVILLLSGARQFPNRPIEMDHLARYSRFFVYDMMFRL